MPARRARATYAPDDKTAAQERFCKALAKEGNVSEACRLSKVARATVYSWLRDDPAFKADYDIANELANDVIRHEIYRRGVKGWVEVEESITYDSSILDAKGMPTIAERKIRRVEKYDSGLLKFLASSRMEEFKDRLDVTTDGKTLSSGWDNLADIIADPARANAAATLITELAGYRLDPGGPSVDS